METIFEGIKVIFFGVLMFSIIITIHEAGHFTAARLFGLRVKEFMLGLPGPNIGFTFNGTKFGVTPFLLGGYALIAGEGAMKQNPNLVSAYTYLAAHGKLADAQAREAERTLGYDLEEALDILDAWGTIKRTKSQGIYTYHMLATAEHAFGQPREVPEAPAHIAAERKLTFNAAPWYQRVIILAAGVIFNLVFAIIVFTAALMFLGEQTPTTTFEEVVAESPAAQAGIAPGDKIVALQGESIEEWTQFTQAMQTFAPGDDVTVGIDRNGVVRDYKITLADNDGLAMLGVRTKIESKPISFGAAFTQSVGFIGEVARGIMKLFNPATFNEVVSQSASVVGVSFEAKSAAEGGFFPFIVLAAALSISIGLMNLLPLPPLDGGRIVVETIERIARRRIPLGIVSGVSVTALVLLISLFVYVTGHDVQRYIFGG